MRISEGSMAARFDVIVPESSTDRHNDRIIIRAGFGLGWGCNIV